jgi:hypothetical protein
MPAHMPIDDRLRASFAPEETGLPHQLLEELEVLRPEPLHRRSQPGFKIQNGSASILSWPDTRGQGVMTDCVCDTQQPQPIDYGQIR